MRAAGRAPRAAFVVTHPMSAEILMRGQLAFLREAGWQVTVVASPGPELDRVREGQGVATVGVPMSREMSPLADLRAAVRLRRELRRLGPDLVNAGTPKAGLLGMLAAWAARVPVRVYMLRGLRLDTETGRRRRILAATERLASACAHRVLAVSPSLARRYVELGLAPAGKVAVVGDGSSNGVDVERFRPGPRRSGEPVVGFVGRLTRDKGIVELEAAFRRLLERRPDARLLLVGDFEDGDPVPATCAERLRRHPRVTVTGFVRDTAPWYGEMDVLAFPSHREGFPNVPLEAAASGLPVAGFRVTGTVDAVASGETGTLVEPGDAEGLARALLAYLEDGALRRAHGEAGRARAAGLFRSEVVWRAYREAYEALLAARGVSLG